MLRPLAAYLQRLGLIAPPVPPAAASPAEWLLARYREDLLVQPGLVATTLELNVRMVRPFLAGRVDGLWNPTGILNLVGRGVAAALLGSDLLGA